MATTAPVTCYFFSDRNAQALTEYSVQPINLRDATQVNQYVQSKLIRAARLSLDASSSPQERQETLDAAIRVASEISLLAGSEALRNVEAASYVLYTSLVKLHPEVTPDSACDMLRDERNYDEYLDIALPVIKGQLASRPADKANKPEPEAKQDTANPTISQQA